MKALSFYILAIVVGVLPVVLLTITGNNLGPLVSGLISGVITYTFLMLFDKKLV